MAQLRQGPMVLGIRVHEKNVVDTVMASSVEQRDEQVGDWMGVVIVMGRVGEEGELERWKAM